MNPIRIAVAGINGKMGRAVEAAIANDGRFVLSAGVVKGVGTPAERSSSVWGPDLVPRVSDVRELRGATDVVIEFTTSRATTSIATGCREAGIPLVSGTTGLGSDQFESLQHTSRDIPVLWSANMSIGMTAIRNILADLARLLNGYDVEIVERHHRRKVDAPSGTALELGRLVAGGIGADFDSRAVYGRHGATPRTPSDIGVHAVRAGGDPGSHTVIFGGEGGEVTVSHRAFGRECYAQGALEAATFLFGRAPGLYSMSDVIAPREQRAN